MKQDKTENPIYHHDTLEFVTVAAEYCAFLEKGEEHSPKEFVSTLLKLLPLLYMKAQMLPEVDSEGDFMPDGCVTEDDYNFIMHSAYRLLGRKDEYEELVYDTDMETEESKWCSVSEDLADIYQVLRNFVFSYQQRVEPCMLDALWSVRYEFGSRIGQTLLCALKQLHKVTYRNSFTNSDYDEEDFE